MGTQGNFDVLFGKIVTILETYSAAQIAAERFSVYPDHGRDIPNNDDIAMVLPLLGPVTPTDKTTTDFTSYDAVYYIDMFVKGKGTRGETYTKAGEAAGIRLRLLIQQVIDALFPAGNRLLSMSAGTVATKAFQVTPFFPEGQSTERILAAARLTLTVGLAWEPVAVEGTDLESISVTADKWSALLTP